MQLRGVVPAIGGRTLLGPVTVSLAVGELLALQGPSGAGKTTLLRTVAGLIDPLEGEILLRGKPAEDFGWPSYRRRVVLVDQQPVLLDGTVRENLERPWAYASAKEAKPEERRFTQELERLNLPPRLMDEPARNLSVGEGQRVCLVRALLLCPDVLLLDEPTSAMDAEATDRAEQLIRERVVEVRGTALIITHRDEQAARWCDRTIRVEPVSPLSRKADAATSGPSGEVDV